MRNQAHYKNIPALAVLIFAGSAATQGIIFSSTADPNFNIARPSDQLGGAQWDMTGNWGVFLGTAIGPNCFITAQHIGGKVGDQFILGGVSYTTTALYDDPGSDLRVWRISGVFPAYSSLFTGTDETGKDLVVFGRGTQRGAAVMGSGFFGDTLKGWLWAVEDGVKRWGENQVDKIVTDPGTGWRFLSATFDDNGSANEADLSTGDSGGPVFLEENGSWKLAGVCYAVDSPYNTTASGAGFYACLFDEGGFYKGGEGNWVYTTDLPSAQPGRFYATQISSRTSWIQGILNTAAQTGSPIVQSTSIVNGAFSDDQTAVVDSSSQTIQIPRSSSQKFFRLRGDVSYTITAAARNGSSITLHYSSAN